MCCDLPCHTYALYVATSNHRKVKNSSSSEVLALSSFMITTGRVCFLVRNVSAVLVSQSYIQKLEQEQKDHQNTLVSKVKARLLQKKTPQLSFLSWPLFGLANFCILSLMMMS